jgi:hypothetical protein
MSNYSFTIPSPSVYTLFAPVASPAITLGTIETPVIYKKMRVDNGHFPKLNRDDYPTLEMFEHYQRQYGCFKIYLNPTDRVKEVYYKELCKGPMTEMHVSMAMNYEACNWSFHTTPTEIVCKRYLPEYREKIIIRHAMSYPDFYQTSTFKALAKVLKEEGYTIDQESKGCINDDYPDLELIAAKKKAQAEKAAKVEVKVEP